MSTNHMAEAERTRQIDFTRQRDWFDPGRSDARVTLVGCGGIGSPTAMALAKLGIPKMTLIDGDTVELHNLPNQLFMLDSVGDPKVDALYDMLGKIGVSEVETHDGFLTAEGIVGGHAAHVQGGYKPSGIVVSGLDSMAARKEVWKTIRYNTSVPFYVDARLGGERVVLHTVDPSKPDQCRRYEETLFDDEDALPLPCTRRSIIDVGFVVASLVTRAVRRHLAGEQPEFVLFWNHEKLRASVGKDGD